jgi:replicative DNA helicase
VSDLMLDQLEAQYADASLPPNVLLSERALLGGVLFHGIRAARNLRGSDLYSQTHRDLFQFLLDAYSRHPDHPYIDPLGVVDELFRHGRNTWAPYVLDLYHDAIWLGVNTDSAQFHLERILDTAEARIVQAHGIRLSRAGLTSQQVDLANAELQAAIADLRRRRGDDTDEMDATQLAELVRVGKLAAATTVPARSTGLIDLDRVLSGGLRPSTFNVLGARPGVGKSLLAGSIAVHMGRTGAARVVYLTMELSAAEVTNRMLADIGDINLTHLQNPEQLTDRDYAARDWAEEKLADWPIHIVEGAKTIDQIEATAHQYLDDTPSGLLIVDFLQRIREDGSATSRERHVAMTASRLTDLSRDLRIPVLCVVSFSRDSVKRGSAPRMDDIRDSGNVESDADTVMLLWQPEPTVPDRIEVVVDKNRYGEVTTLDLTRQGNRGRLVSRAKDWVTA